jgi:hypothetical protein
MTPGWEREVTRYFNLLLSFFAAGVLINISPELLELLGL